MLPFNPLIEQLQQLLDSAEIDEATHAEILAIVQKMIPTHIETHPIGSSIEDIIYAQGFNDCCDQYFGGGFKRPDPIVFEIETTTSASFELVGEIYDDYWGGPNIDFKNLDTFFGPIYKKVPPK